MSAKMNTAKILKELTDNIRYIHDEQLDNLTEMIIQANHIFTAGAGRSGIVVKAFTNRLMQLGLSASSVGDISNPHTKPSDLLIIGSGSGETESLVAMARKSKKQEVKIALITMDASSSIAQMADTVVVLPGVSPKLKNVGLDLTSIQPMGSAFEQMTFLAYDGIVLELMERMHETSETMFERHTDLE